MKKPPPLSPRPYAARRTLPPRRPALLDGYVGGSQSGEHTRSCRKWKAQEAQKLKCVSASLGKIEEEDRPRITVRGNCSPSCKIRKPEVAEEEKGYLYTGEAYTPKRRTRASVFPPFSTMFIPSGPWTALPGNDVLQYTQPKPQFPFYHGPLGGVTACDSHLLGLKGWYWAQAVAFWKAQQTMAQDNWMSGSGVDEVRYSFAFCFSSMTGPRDSFFVQGPGRS